MGISSPTPPEPGETSPPDTARPNGATRGSNIVPMPVPEPKTRGGSKKGKTASIVPLLPQPAAKANSTGPLNGAHHAERHAAPCDTEGSSPNADDAGAALDDQPEPEAAVDKLEAVRDCLALYHEVAAGLDGVFVLTVVDRPVIDHTGREKEGKARPQKFAIGDVEGMAAEAVARSAVGNVYFAPAVLRKDLPRGSRGKFEDIVAILGAVIDDDGDTGKRALRPPGIEPSIEVTTSTVPVVNQQPHFVYTRPLAPAEGAGLAELLHRKCGGDSGTGDGSHCWRLPQTLNYPNAKKINERGRPSEPQPVQLTGGTFERVDPDEFRVALEAMPDREPPRGGAEGSDDTYSGGETDREAILARLPHDLRELMAREKGKNGDRSDHCFGVMQRLMEFGLTDDEIRIVAEGEPFAAKFSSRGDLDEEIRRARAKWKANGAKTDRRTDHRLWGEIDLSVCERSQVNPPVVSTDGFGLLGPWIDAAAEAAAAPVDYVALSALSAVSGMVGGRRWVSPWDGWREPCIIWGILVGDPSVNKTPAKDEIHTAVVTAEEEKGKGFPALEAKYEADVVAAKALKKAWERRVEKALKEGKKPPTMPQGAMEPKRPIRPRSWVVNVTTEKLFRIMSDDPGGVLAWNDELAGLIGSFDRYGGGGMDRAAWLECYGGRPYRLDRVKDGTIDVPCTAAAVLGTIQPDRLNTLVLGGDNDGFASRFLYAWPEPRLRKRPKRAPDRELILKTFRRLAGLRYAPGDPHILALDKKAANAFEHWWTGEHSRDIAAASGVLAEAYSKMSGGVLRIALALEYIWWATSPREASEPKVVSYKALSYALILIDEWAKPMAARALAEASIPRAQLQAMVLARWIRANKVETFNARTALRKHRPELPGIRETKDMDEACTALVEACWIRPAGTRQGGTKGRRSKDFEVNPALREKSASTGP